MSGSRQGQTVGRRLPKTNLDTFLNHTLPPRALSRVLILSCEVNVLSVASIAIIIEIPRPVGQLLEQEPKAQNQTFLS